MLLNNGYVQFEKKAIWFYLPDSQYIYTLNGITKT